MIRKQDYPAHWKELSLQVREQAGQRCEWCGAPNHTIIRRISNPAAGERDFHIVLAVGDEPANRMTWKRLRFHRLTKVIITVAHLDRDSGNNDRGNLAALCQRCHLQHDIRQHVANRKYGRYHSKEHQAKLDFSTAAPAAQNK